MKGRRPFSLSAMAAQGPSGTSPTHLPSFHSMTALAGFHGLPFISTEARLYRMRRFTGQHHDQFGYRPIFACISVCVVSRRLDLLPSSSVQLPVYSQFSEEVEPSSFRFTKEGTSCPRL